MCNSVSFRRLILALFLLAPTTLPATTARILSKALCATIPKHSLADRALRRIPTPPISPVITTPMRWHSTTSDSKCDKTIHLTEAHIYRAIPNPDFLAVSNLIPKLANKNSTISTIIKIVDKATYDYIIHLQIIHWQDPTINQHIEFKIPVEYQTPGKRALMLALIPSDRHDEANAEISTYFRHIRQL